MLKSRIEQVLDGSVYILTILIGNDEKVPTLPDGSRDVIHSWHHTEAWPVMESLVETGKVRGIGVCNVRPHQPCVCCVCCMLTPVSSNLVQQEIPRGTPPQSQDCPSRQSNRKPPQPPPAGSRRPLQRKGHPRRRLQPSGKHGQPSVYGGCCCQGGREERSQPWYCSSKLSW